MGSVARDAGRTEQAIGMFEKAIQIGEAVATDDPEFLSRNFAANYDLAELLYDRGQPQRAAPYAASAFRIANQLYSSDPDNMEWQKLLGFSYTIQTKGAMCEKRYLDALRASERAVAISWQLVVRNPDNDRLLSDLATLLARQGQCLRLLNQLDRSLARYEAAYRIHLDLASRGPEIVDRQLDVGLTENRIASWHMTPRTPEGNRQAAIWLDKAEKTVALVSGMRGAENCSADIGRLRDGVKRNKEILAKRNVLATTAAKPATDGGGEPTP
ncbi:MAG: tetratricopeptide repeat protein [Planctomycetes bacterium]|nr:tetratricopeptide repeat protein [Planctomycetota bacterium]